MTISIKARKAKGRKLQNYIRDLILACFPLDKEDVRCALMGESGVDIKLSKKAKFYLPYAIECKNDENKSIWKCWEQAVKNSKENQEPLLFMMKNRHEPLAIIRPRIIFDLIYELRKDETKRQDTSSDNDCRAIPSN